MHNLTRTVVASALLGLIASSQLRAQFFDLPKCDSGYVHIDSIHSQSFLGPLTGSVSSDEEGAWWSGVGITTSQDTVLTIFAESIVFNNTDTRIDTVSTDRIFDHLAVETVRTAIFWGHLTPAGYQIRKQVRVYAPACLQRLGSGSNTLFFGAPTCDASFRVLEYWISLQGSLEVALLSSESGVECGIGYVSTVEPEGGVTLK